MFRSLPILREDCVEDSSANRKHCKSIIGWFLFAEHWNWTVFSSVSTEERRIMRRGTAGESLEESNHETSLSSGAGPFRFGAGTAFAGSGTGENRANKSESRRCSPGLRSAERQGRSGEAERLSREEERNSGVLRPGLHRRLNEGASGVPGWYRQRKD